MGKARWSTTAVRLTCHDTHVGHNTHRDRAGCEYAGRGWWWRDARWDGRIPRPPPAGDLPEPPPLHQFPSHLVGEKPWSKGPDWAELPPTMQQALNEAM